MFQYSKNLDGTKTDNKTDYDLFKFQYSKNLEGTKTRARIHEGIPQVSV